MKAYLIDTPNREVREVEYDGNWRTIASTHLHCSLFTVVVINEAEDVVYVDDEGLINGNPHGWFELVTYGQPLRGYGLVLGTDPEGESIAPAISLEDLKKLVRFSSSVDESSIDREVRVRSL